MTGWDELLRHLAEAPRENGTPAVHETARWLFATLQQAGLHSQMIPYVAQPHRLRIAGIVVLIGCLIYFALMRLRQPAAALVVALVLPVLLFAEIDGVVSLFGGIGAQAQHHVLARIPVPHPAQRLIFSAHFDTKTDLLDHVERAPVDFLGVPVTLLMVAGAAAFFWALRNNVDGPPPRVARIAAMGAVVYGIVVCAVLSGGALLSEGSSGALDDGSACAVLVRLAESLHASGPLSRTEVEILLLSAEEAGVQGSAEYAKARFAAPPDLPTSVINLEFLGAAADLAIFKSERFSVTSYAADPQLVALLDEVHREKRGKPIHITWYGAATDARSFLAPGIPAATLLSDLPGHALARGMHRPADNRSRVDPAALDSTVDYLLAVVRRADAG